MPDASEFDRVLLLMGPTASGKTALALALAARTGAEILNADSMQVYRDLAVLTNRPTDAELAQAPHHLFGHVDAAERYSAGAWLAQAEAALEGVRRRGRPAIVVGGTGLYFKALTEGLAPAPAAPPAVRERLLAELARVGPAGLHARLAEADPTLAARLSPTDAPRLLRALEVWEATGAPLSQLQQSAKGGLSRARWVGLRLEPPRAALRERIAARFAAMLERGALAEAQRLAARRLPEDRPILKAHGLPWLLAHLRGELSLAAAAERAVADTRRYAKRQRTWMTHQMPDWPVIVADLLQARVEEALQQWRGVDATQASP